MLKTNLLSLSLLVGLTLWLLSCGGDKEDAKPTISTDPADLIGKWEAVSLEVYNCNDATQNSVSACGTGNHCITLTILNDGTLIEELSGTVNDGNYEIYSGFISLFLTHGRVNSWQYSVHNGNQLYFEDIDTTECSEKWIFNKVE